MRISDKARHYFKPNANDSPETVRMKNYFVWRDNMEREIIGHGRITEFDEKCNRILKMKPKSTLDELKMKIAIEELFGTK